jgi:uncharacterized protein (TIGR02300 family)
MIMGPRTRERRLARLSTPAFPQGKRFQTVAKTELGTKRICPETGRKFYDLNKDPIVSPYTGKQYPLSYFQDTSTAEVLEKEEPEAVEEVDAENENENVEIVSLDDADDEATGSKSGKDDENLPDIDNDDDDDVEIDDDDDDTFLEDDEDDDDDVSDIIGVGDDDDDS